MMPRSRSAYRRLQQALALFWRSLRRPPLRVAAKQRLDEYGGHRAAARARFWAELREGQRDAEVQGISSIGRSVRQG
jgi:hypothetical protein